MLIPLTYNDGTEIPPQVVTRLTDRFLDLFGGFTIRGTVNGAYRMADGSRAEDVSLEVWVAIDGRRVDEMRCEVSRACRELGQESIYFEVTESQVELVDGRLFAPSGHGND